MLKQFLFLLTFTSAAVGYSQLTNLNPLSSYGIGSQIIPTDAIQSAMGGGTIAFADSTMISFYNAAHIASITKGYPLFSFGVNGSATQFTEGTATYNRAYAALNQLIFAVPFKKRYGLSLGLTPYARRGYEFNAQQAVGTESDTATFIYTGYGSIGKAFVGLSYKIVDQKRFQFSVGSNVGYLFGTTTNSRRSTINTSGTEGLGLQSDRLQSLHYDVSFSTRYQINPTNSFQVNGQFEPSQKLTGRFADEVYYLGSSAAGGSIILVESINTKATYISAPTLRIGANYSFHFTRNTNKNKTFESQLIFTGEMVNTAYSSFRKDYNAISYSFYTKDYSRLSFGMQYTPNLGYYRTLDATSFWNKMKYRVGTYTSTLPYTYQGQVFTEFGTTFGIGIPLATSNTYSSINVGFDLGKKSNSISGALNEKYIGFQLGIIIAPSKADYWFRKVKLD